MELTGEYWIQDDGSVDYADGDIGDQNHESIVMRQVQGLIVGEMGGVEGPNGQMKPEHKYDKGEYIDWDGFLQDLETVFGDEDRQLAVLKAAGVGDDEWAAANGFEDAREYAAKKWGWKSIRGHHLETWTLNKKDIKAIIDGVENILEQDGFDDSEPDEELELYIHVYSTGKSYDVTLQQLKDWLNPQQTQVANMWGQNRDLYTQWLRNNANKQVKDMDLDLMHPTYKRPGVNPFGDSVMGFKVWLNEHMDRKAKR